MRGRVEGIEVLAEAQGVELIAPLLKVWASDVPTLPPSLRSKLNNPTAAPRNSFGV